MILPVPLDLCHSAASRSTQCSEQWLQLTIRGLDIGAALYFQRLQLTRNRYRTLGIDNRIYEAKYIQQFPAPLLSRCRK